MMLVERLRSLHGKLTNGGEGVATVDEVDALLEAAEFAESAAKIVASANLHTLRGM